MPITDLTGYTWVGNDNVALNSYIQYLINFTSNSRPYTRFGLDVDGLNVYYNSTITYSSGSWTNSAYKTIEITGGTDVTNSTLIAWLEANGTLTAPQPTQTDKIFVGNLSLAKAFVGNSEVSKIYLGNVKLYEK